MAREVAQLAASGQSEADYRIPKGLQLRDEIGRYWRIAQAHWAELVTGIERGADGRALAERFATGILRESFGFASLAQAEPVVIAERSYPIARQIEDIFRRAFAKQVKLPSKPKLSHQG